MEIYKRKEEKNMDNKKVLSVVLCVVIALFLIIFSANIYISNADDTDLYYFSDLKTGEFIPNGSLLIMNLYFYQSGWQPKTPIELFFIDENGNEIENTVLSYNSSYEVLSVEGYDGWVLDEFSGYRLYAKFKVAKKPVEENISINEPNAENGYQIGIGENVAKNSSFYKINDTVKPSIDKKCAVKDGIVYTYNEGKIIYEVKAENNSNIRFYLKSVGQRIRINNIYNRIN